MDSLITLDEAAGFLKNPPSLSPRPDFWKLFELLNSVFCILLVLNDDFCSINGGINGLDFSYFKLLEFYLFWEIDYVIRTPLKKSFLIDPGV